MGPGAVIVAVCVLVVVGVALSWAIQRYGLDGARELARGALRAAWARLHALSTRYRLLDLDGRLRLRYYYRRRGGGGGAGFESLRFVRFVDAAHRISFVHPDTWTVARADHPGASIVVQLACDGDDEAYKRFSVAWDDVSWSATTSESFGRAVAAQLPALVPGSQLLAHGPYLPARPLPLPPAAAEGGGRAAPCEPYQLVYRLVDPLDGTVLQLLNVVFVSVHGGRRRAYTVTFGADADAYADALRLARHMVDSFKFEDGDEPLGAGGAGDARGGSPVAPLLGGGGGGGGGARGGASSGAPASPSTPGTADGEEEAHVNVWERGLLAASAGGGYVAPSLPPPPPQQQHSSSSGGGGGGTQPRTPSSKWVDSSSGSSPHRHLSFASSARWAAGACEDTPATPADVAWASSSLPAAGLAYSHPQQWWAAAGSSSSSSSSSSGGGGRPDDAAPSSGPGGAAPEWLAACFTCDRRESCFKGMSVLCVDVTQCAELLARRPPGGLLPQQQQAQQPPLDAAPGGSGGTGGALLLQYLLYRYRCEAAENESLAHHHLSPQQHYHDGGAGGAGGAPPAGLTPADEPLRPWLQALSQRWPAGCRLSAPAPVCVQSPGGAVGSGGGGRLGGLASTSTRRSRGVSLASALSGVSGGSGGLLHAGGAPAAALAMMTMGDLVTAPHQARVLDVRAVASSRLLKVAGWLRTSGGGGPAASPAAAAPRSASLPHSDASLQQQRRYSSYSTVSMDADASSIGGGGGLPAEGQLIATTSAVLIGIHEVAAAGGAAAPARVFGHVVTFSTASDDFLRFEPLAKHVFQSLEVIVA